MEVAMLRGLAALTMVLGLWACSEEADTNELKAYVKDLQKLSTFNERVQGYITKLDDPTFEVTEESNNGARKLLEEYAKAVDGVFEPDNNALRSTHELYLRTFVDARRLATDRTGDLKRQAHSVAIGFRNLRRDVGLRLYPSIAVLLARKNLETEEYALNWPYPEK